MDGKGSGISAELEAEADAFASRTLIPVQYLPQLPQAFQPLLTYESFRAPLASHLASSSVVFSTTD